MKGITERLFESRTVYMNTDFNEESTSGVIAQLLALAADGDDPIKLYISSPGGLVYHGLGVIDTMNTISAPVHTFAVGLAASMGFMTLINGEKGHRYALKNATIMAHQLSGGTRGTFSDMKVDFEEAKRLNDLLKSITVEKTGLPQDRVDELFAKDSWLSPQAALELGVIDKIL